MLLLKRACAALSIGLFFAVPAQATTFSFGAPILSGTTDLSSGSSSDVDSSQSAQATATTASFRAQASADSFVSGAVSDVEFTWQVPYTITRNVTVDNFEAIFPLQAVAFDISFSGGVAVDDDFFSTERAEIFDLLTISSLGGLFSDVTFDGAVRDDDEGATLLAPGSQLTAYGTTVEFEDGLGAGEISFAVPSDYRSWEDFVAPLALDYGTPQVVVQSFTDTLEVSMRLRAESSAGGGEALACAGLQSGLGSFGLLPNCGDGISIFGQIGSIGSETLAVAIPEPGAFALLGIGFGALLFTRRPRTLFAPGRTR